MKEPEGMRLWSIHPKYLDRQGLAALWREALLCQAVLSDETKGYRHHPQLARFQAQADPLSAIGAYLQGVRQEAAARGYDFDRKKIRRQARHERIDVAAGQVDYEWRHLMAKLAARSPGTRLMWQGIQVVESHPLFEVVPGAIEPWERPNG